MGKRIERIPYQRIEWLEVSQEGGQAWIETDFVPKNSNDFEFEFLLHDYIINPSTTTTIAFFTTMTGAVNTSDCIYRVVHSTKYFVTFVDWGNHASSGSNAITLNIEPDIKYELSTEGRTYYLNGSKGTLKSRNADNHNYPIVLFGSTESYFLGKIYKFRVTDAGETLLDLVPVRIGDEGFMYDRVSGRLFGNAGSGKFLLGPDIK